LTERFMVRFDRRITAVRRGMFYRLCYCEILKISNGYVIHSTILYLTRVDWTLLVSFSDKKSKFMETLAKNAILRRLNTSKSGLSSVVVD
jgi:hypothetical protein